MSEGAYRVVVTREDGHWLADLPGLPGAHTYARSLPKLDQAVREVVVLAADLPDEAMPGLTLDYDYHTGDADLDATALEVRQLRLVLDELAAAAAARSNRPGRRRACGPGPVRPRCCRLARHQPPACSPAHRPGKLTSSWRPANAAAGPRPRGCGCQLTRPRLRGRGRPWVGQRHRLAARREEATSAGFTASTKER